MAKREGTAVDPGRLPPGQREIDKGSRSRPQSLDEPGPEIPKEPALRIGGDVECPCDIPLSGLADIPHREQVSDFHCVTTASKRGLRWGGWALREFYEQVVVPRARPREDARYILFRGLDGFSASLPLEDALASDVLLADTLEGDKLSPANGAPIRTVAPAHYGYKSVKHLCAIELRRTIPRDAGGLLAHPRGRVGLEERVRIIPGWLYRQIIRPVIGFFRLYERLAESWRRPKQGGGEGGFS